MASEKTSSWKYLLSDIDFGQAENEAVLAVLATKWLSMGPKTQEFEYHFGQYVAAPFVLASANCTSALHMALLALNIGCGDEVIVPSLTFVATSNAVLYTGAKPVFADIQALDTPLIDPDQIEKKITPATKAIIVMHYAGYPCDMEKVVALANQHGLYVIEDAAHAIGSYYQGAMCGTIGDVGCYSFFANKNLATGEGGMLVTRHRDIYDRAVKLRSHGMTTLTWDRARGGGYTYDVVALGQNYRPTEICAAIGMVQLQKLAESTRKRNTVFDEYIKRLKNTKGIMLPFSDTAACGGYARHLLPIVLTDKRDRTAFREKLAEFGIQTSMHYPPVHTFSYYQSILQGYQAQDLDMTETFAERVVTLPMHPLLTGRDVGEICEGVELALAAQ